MKQSTVHLLSIDWKNWRREGNLKENNNEYYNPSWDISPEDAAVRLVPVHVYYKVDSLICVADIINLTDEKLEHISVELLELSTPEADTFARDSFGECEGLELGPGKFQQWSFQFEPGSFLRDVELDGFLNLKSHIRWY